MSSTSTASAVLRGLRNAPTRIPTDGQYLTVKKQQLQQLVWSRRRTRVKISKKKSKILEVELTQNGYFWKLQLRGDQN
jgi:hypothetical protein